MQIPEMPPIKCPECDGFLALTQNPSWGFRETGKDRAPRLAYLCKDRRCGGKICAHDDGRPMGRPATFKVREERQRCHAIFDLLWLNIYDLPEFAHVFGKTATQKNQKQRADLRTTARDRAYLYMAYHLGLEPTEAHIGMITDLDTLRRFKKLASDTSPKGVQAWWRDKGKAVYKKARLARVPVDSDITSGYTGSSFA